MNYRSLTDGEKDVEESPSQCGPDQMDLASLARLAINPFFAESSYISLIFRGFKKFLPSAEPMDGSDSSLVTFRLAPEHL